MQTGGAPARDILAVMDAHQHDQAVNLGLRQVQFHSSRPAHTTQHACVLASIWRCRTLHSAVQQLDDVVVATGLASGGSSAALSSEWCAKGAVQTAAASVLEALQAVLDAPAGVPLHHHPLAVVGTAGLVQLCFLRDEGAFNTVREGVGAVALRLHLALGCDPLLQEWQQQQHGTGYPLLLLRCHPFAGEQYLQLGMQHAW